MFENAHVTEHVGWEEGDDFQFILNADSTYWFNVPGDFTDYRRVLRMAFGRDFEILETKWNMKDRGSGKAPKVVSTWVVLKTKDQPLVVSAEMMGAPSMWEPGMTPESTGSFEENPGIPDKVAALEAWSRSIVNSADDWSDRAVATAKQVLQAPEKFAKGVKEEAKDLLWIVGGLALGALVIYRATTKD